MAKMSRAFAILLVSLVVISQSLSISSDHASGLTVIQAQHSQQQQQLEARQLLRSSDHHDRDQPPAMHWIQERKIHSSPFDPRDLKKPRTYMKKGARTSAGRGYIATRGRRHRSAAIQTSHISSFQVAAVLAYSLLIGFFVL